MNRRGFLSTLGAALTLPLLPGALTKAAPAAVNRYTYGLAALHARIEAKVPLSELARRFGLSPAQSQALAGQLVSDGLVTQHGSTLHATRPLGQRLATAAPAKAQQAAQAKQQRADSASHEASVDPMMAYLHDLCTRCGIPIAPAAGGYA